MLSNFLDEIEQFIMRLSSELMGVEGVLVVLSLDLGGLGGISGESSGDIGGLLGLVSLLDLNSLGSNDSLLLVSNISLVWSLEGNGRDGSEGNNKKGKFHLFKNVL